MNQKHYIIRGPRIVRQLDERTMVDLERNTKNFQPPASPDARQNAVNQVQIPKMEFSADRLKHGLIIKATAVSGGQQYEPSIMFDEVVYEDSDQADNTTFKAKDRKEYHIIPIDLTKHNAKVRCNCLDFYYRFAPQNNKDDSLLGPAPPPYIKKTNRPPVNPQKVPGVCKHLLRMVQALKQINIVR